jgi:2'-5' RNA ligase
VVDVDDAEGALAALFARIAAVTDAHGLPPEPRPLRPHVTLARAKHADVRALIDRTPPPPTPLTVQALVLYESHAGRYTPRARTVLPPRSLW